MAACSFLSRPAAVSSSRPAFLATRSSSMCRFAASSCVTQRALSVTQRALSVTQRALNITQRALSVTQRALSVTQRALRVTQRSLSTTQEAHLEPGQRLVLGRGFVLPLRALSPCTLQRRLQFRGACLNRSSFILNDTKPNESFVREVCEMT
jgi:hypothetical protein